MPINRIGISCARLGCSRPHWQDKLCSPCWRLAKLSGKDPALLAAEPLISSQGIDLPWADWERAAKDKGCSMADYIAGDDHCS